MEMSEGEVSRLQEHGLTLSSVQAAHEQAQICAHMLECLWLHSWASLPTAVGLTGFCDLWPGKRWSFFTKNLSTEERSKI